MGQAYTGEAFADLTLISRGDGTRVRLGDVATVRDAFEDQPVLSRLNGRPSLTLEVDYSVYVPGPPATPGTLAAFAALSFLGWRRRRPGLR